MFKFFRTHQKFLFVIIAGIIILTFTFFGTHSTFDSSNRRVDKVISKTIDGRKIKRSQIEEISHFLIRDEDISLRVNSGDGFLSKELFQTKVIESILSPYLVHFFNQYEEKFPKLKTYVPYEHSKVSSISAKNIWNQFNINIIPLLAKFQSRQHFDKASFALYTDLYLEQKKFSPIMLKKVLEFQKTQYQWLRFDNLNESDLALFHYQSIVDWFGLDFIDLVSQYILHLGNKAKKQKLTVSKEEAKISLIEKAKVALKSDENMTENEKFSYFLRAIGMKEAHAIAVWGKILLCKKYLDNYGDSVFVDNLSCKELSNIKNEKVNIKTYELSKNIKLDDLNSFLCFKFYLDATTDMGKEGNFILSKYRDVDQVVKAFPQLVERRFKLGIKHITKSDAALTIPVKKMWEWQLEDANWEKIKSDFPALSLAEGKDRFTFLESLPVETRVKIDDFSKDQMLRENSSLVSNMLQMQDEKIKEIGIKHKPLKNLLNGIDDKKLLSLLMKIDLSAESEPLVISSDNNEDYYQLRLITKANKDSIVSYKDAMFEKILSSMIESKLRIKYDSLNGEELKKFSDLNNSKKPFYDIKDDLAKLYYKDLLNAINHKKKYFGIKDNSENKYGLYFAYFHLNEVKDKLKDGLIEDKDILNSIWDIDIKNVSINKQSEDELKEQVFGDSPLKFSYPIIMKDNNVMFYEFINKEIDKKQNIKEMLSTKKILSDEAKADISLNIINELSEKNLIVIPIDRKAK